MAYNFERQLHCKDSIIPCRIRVDWIIPFGIQVNVLTDIQRSVLNFLQIFIKSLNQKDLCRFKTCIRWRFTSRTSYRSYLCGKYCSDQEHAYSSWSCKITCCYNKLVKEFTNILNSRVFYFHLF